MSLDKPQKGRYISLPSVDRRQWMDSKSIDALNTAQGPFKTIMPGITNDELTGEVLQRFNEMLKTQHIVSLRLATALNTKANTVSGWTNGDRMINPIYLAALPRAFREMGKLPPNLHYLLTGEGPMYMAMDPKHDDPYALGAFGAIAKLSAGFNALVAVELAQVRAAPPVATKDLRDLERGAGQVQPRKRRAAHKGRRGAT